MKGKLGSKGGNSARLPRGTSNIPTNRMSLKNTPKRSKSAAEIGMRQGRL